MSNNAQIILDQALALSAGERAKLAEGLLSSLDQPDPEIDVLWAQEAESRIAAYESGAIRSVSEEDVLNELDRP